MLLKELLANKDNFENKESQIVLKEMKRLLDQ